MRDLLYIDGTLIDLDDKSTIAQTIKAWDVGDIRTRNANYTNRIKVPMTPNNRNTFGFPEDDNSQTDKPYIKLPCKLIQNGSETIPSGLAIITEAEDVYVVELYSGIISFFDEVSEKTLRDLDLSDFDSAGPTPKITYPFIDYGTMDETDNPLVLVGQEYPSFEYKTLIEQIIIQNGYTKNGSVFDDAKLSALYLSALGFGGYSEAFTKPKEFLARRDTSVVFNATGSNLKVNFTEVESNADGWYDGTNTYTVQDPQGGVYGGSWFLFEGYAYVDVNVVLAGGASGVTLEIFTPTSGPYAVSLGNGNNKRNLEISARTNGTQVGLTGPISGIEGNEFYMRARTSNGIGTATLTFVEAVLWNKVLPDIVIYTSAIGVMPLIKQKELMQDFFMRYGILAREGSVATKVMAALSEFTNLGAGATNWVTGVAPTITIAGFGTTKQLHGVLNASGKCTFEYDIDVTRSSDLTINILDEAKALIRQTGGIAMAIGNNTGEVEILVPTTARYISIQVSNNSASTCDVVVNVFDLQDQINSNNDKVLILKTIKEIIQDTSGAVDWTSKRDARDIPNSKFKFRNYAQNNYFKFENPDNLQESYARGNLDIPNLNTQNERDLFTSLFGISETLKMGNESAGYITAARIPVYEDGVETNDPGPRLTMLRDRRDPEPSLSGPGTGYKVAYTVDTLAPIDLSWQLFLDDSYVELKEALSKARLKTHYYNLTEEDIASLNIQRLIFDSGSYYLLSTIFNYVPNEVTKVELFKVA
jgi:hypothetical protein